MYCISKPIYIYIYIYIYKYCIRYHYINIAIIIVITMFNIAGDLLGIEFPETTRLGTTSLVPSWTGSAYLRQLHGC